MTSTIGGVMDVVALAGIEQAGLTRKPVPTVREDYALVRVLVAPMCNEYVAFAEGRYLERNRPDSLGHEFAGEIVSAPGGSGFSAGDRVVALCGFPCGDCVPCRRGYYAHCARPDDPREVCGSTSGECGFAQYAVKPAWMLERIPDGMPMEHAAMACCGLGPTFGALRRAELQAGQTVLITGLGAVGLGGVITAKAGGATVIGVGRSPHRVKMAKALGCDAVIGPDGAQLRDLTDGQGPDIVLECSGQPKYQRFAIDQVARLGTVAFLAEPGTVEINVDRDLVQRGVRLLGTLDIRRPDCADLLRLIASVGDRLDTYITHRLPLADVGRAFEAQQRFETGKVVLYPWPDNP